MDTEKQLEDILEYIEEYPILINIEIQLSLSLDMITSIDDLINQIHRKLELEYNKEKEKNFQGNICSNYYPILKSCKYHKPISYTSKSFKCVLGLLNHNHICPFVAEYDKIEPEITELEWEREEERRTEYNCQGQDCKTCESKNCKYRVFKKEI